MSVSSVSAEDTVFSQKILPLNCVFTTVNAGTGELYYVTPEACGVVVGFSPQIQLSTVNPNTLQKSLNKQPGSFTSNAISANSSGQKLYFPWRPIASLAQSNLDAKPSVKNSVVGVVVVIGALIGVAVIIALADFLF